MSAQDPFPIAVGNIATFFGTRMGAYNIDTLLRNCGITLDTQGTKGGKIVKVLHGFRNDPSGLAGFLTSLITIHQLTAEDIVVLNSYLEPIGYVLKQGHVVPTDMAALDEITRKVPHFNKEAQRMAEAYTILHLLENQLRKFIMEKLTEKYGRDWWESAVAKKTRESCDDRKKKEIESPWHEVEESPPVYYTTFEELHGIVQKNWDVFEPSFKDQNAAIGRLTELEIPRNTIAHNRILQPSELERLRLFSRDIFRCILL